MKKQKAQGAMEYLMTYGWAILVVMVVGIVMWQLGIFNIGGTMPPRATGFNYQKPIEATLQFTAGVCDVASTCVRLDMVNGEPAAITISGVPTGTLNDIGMTCTAPAGAAQIGQGVKYSILCGTSVQTLVSGDVAVAAITYTYTVSIAGVTRTRIETGSASGPVD